MKGWLRPYLAALFQEHPARCMMAGLGSLLMLAAAVRFLLNPDAAWIGLGIVFGGGFLLAMGGFGALFLEEIQIGKETRIKLRALTPTPVIESSTVAEKVSHRTRGG